MKRQDRFPDTFTFHYNNMNPKGRLTTDCVFRAISLALEQDYKQTVMEMAEMQCETGYCMTDTDMINRYLKRKGWIKYKQPRKDNGRKYTGKEFCESLLDEEYAFDGSPTKRDRIVIKIGTHHIAAIVDGKVNDTWDSTDGCVGNYWMKGI